MNADVVLTDIRFEPDVQALLGELRIAGRPEYAQRCARLIASAIPAARPKALARLAAIESRGDDGVIVEGQALVSRILRTNVETVNRVFPFVVTCGGELEAWSRGFTEMLDRFWADAVMEAALRAALEALTAALTQRYRLGLTAMMNPGSLADWPLEQQRPLFALLGDTQGRVGVRLNDSLLMTPMKSASGLLFETQRHYENCQLCPRDPCPNRRATYDAELYAREYAGGTVPRKL
jgi:hypothetical protein